jgi:chromosome segregation ATPase
VVQSRVSHAAVDALASVEGAAGAARSGIERVNSRVATARERVGAVQARASEISQEVAATGVARTALPEEMVAQLEAEVSGVTGSFADTRDNLLAIVNLVRALDSIPAIDLPQPDQARVQKAEEAANSLRSLVEGLRRDVADFRAGASGKINQVAAEAASADARLAEIQANLSQLDGQLAALQDRSHSLQQTLPTILFLAALGSTLLLVWVAYTQVVVLRGAWGKIRAGPADQDT